MGKPIITDEQIAAWRRREYLRIIEGENTRVPWSDESWWVDSKPAHDHYAHVSNDDPSKLAYTVDDIKGHADKQARIRPGRYLSKYFSAVLSEVGIQEWAGRFAGANEDVGVSFATTPADIEAVYTGGPRSCMDGEHGHADSTRVYGAGDLAVAYLGEQDHATARSVVWPDKKVYNTIYGDEPRLGPALRSLGYKHASGGDFEGARLLYIEKCGGIVAPYFDGDESGSVREIDGTTYLVLSMGGEHSLSEQTGILGGGDTCERCGDNYDSTEGGGYIDDESWCESCVDSYAGYCESCDESTHCDNMRHATNDRGHEVWVCEYCAENSFGTCGGCNNTFESMSTLQDGENRCESCMEDVAFCEHCDEPHDTTSHTVDDESWCDSCYDSEAAVCDSCPLYGDAYPREQVKMVAGDSLCEDHADERMDEINEALEAAGVGISALIQLPAVAATWGAFNCAV
jgi:hypothetical protein